MKEDAINRTLWKNRRGRGYGSVELWNDGCGCGGDGSGCGCDCGGGSGSGCGCGGGDGCGVGGSGCDGGGGGFILIVKHHCMVTKYLKK